MLVPLELVDQYGRTFIDFWSLRPRKFLPSLDKGPDRYLSPMKFLAISLGIAFSMGVVAVTLSFTAFESATGTRPIGDPKSLAYQLVVFVFVMLVVVTLFYRILCALWPIRARTSFRQIFEFQCYMMAGIVPAGALDVLINPIVIKLVASELLPPWVALLPLLLGGVIGILATFLYSIPGIAYLCGVSSLRLWAAIFVWTFPVGFVGYFVAAFLV